MNLKIKNSLKAKLCRNKIRVCDERKVIQNCVLSKNNVGFYRDRAIKIIKKIICTNLMQDMKVIDPNVDVKMLKIKPDDKDFP